MKNFKMITRDVDLYSLRQELSSTQLWVNMDARPNRPPTHAKSHRIQLRTNKKVAGLSYLNIHEVVDLPAWNSLDVTRELVLKLQRVLGGNLGHVRISMLWGRAEIIPHIDIGEYCAIRDRYHLVIQSPAGTAFTSGRERVTMKEGELWWFDNKQLHMVENLSVEPRIHLIFDIEHSHR